MPYHYLRNFGFILLVMLLTALSVLAVNFADESTEQLKTITASLQKRTEATNQLDNALLQASILYQQDSRLEIIEPKEILANLSSVSVKMKNLRKDFSFTKEEEERAIDTSLFAVRQGLVSLFEMGQQPVDYTVSLLPQIKNHLQKIHFSLSNFAYGGMASFGEKAPLVSCLSRDAMHDLSQLEHLIEKFMTGNGLKLDVVMKLLALSCEKASMLKNYAASDDDHSHELDSLETLLHKLGTNLPRIYDAWLNNRTMSLLAEDVAMVSAIWDEITVTKDQLIKAEKKLMAQELAIITQKARQKQRQFVFLAAFSILFAVAFAFFINSLLSKRISRLKEGTAKLAEGDLSARINMPTRDAIGHLARSFNDMADSLNDKQRELRDSFELLQTSEKLLKMSNEQLEKRVRERTAALSAVNAELQLMGNAFSHALEGILVTDADGHILKANPATAQIVGSAMEKLVGVSIRVFDTGSHDEKFYLSILSDLKEKGAWDGEVLCRRENGDAVPLWLSIARMEKKREKTSYYIASFRDISEHKKQEMLIRHQAMHDSLTGLPNRLLLKDQIHISIAHASRRKKKLVVMFMDLDDFKTINDTQGHSAGDFVLKGVAQRLKTIFRPEDTLCRIGGDEFLAIIGDLDSADFALTIAERILKSLATPFPYNGHYLSVGGSIGMAVYPEDGIDSETLIKNADQAMYAAKAQGKNRIHFFSANMHEYAQERLIREEEIRRGLDANEFTVFFQPIINLTTMQVQGMEALARWHHPVRGTVTPADFLQVCEDSGLMIPVGRRLLEEYCRLSRKILDGCGNDHLSLSFNLSASQLHEEGIVDSISETLQRHGINPSRVGIEITEPSLIANAQKSALVLLLLADMGVKISIDDFGSGYCSLSFLKHLPIDALKIDKTFIRKIPQSASDSGIVAGVASLARHLDMQVVAKGVETVEQLSFLKQCHCHMAQGFLFSKPLPAEEIPAFLKSISPS
ncbi:MAG: EAL domain-containing protein [Pseudomonadota bacterium]